MRNISRRSAMVGLGAAAVVPAVTMPSGKSSGRPNIVFIMADDLGYADLSCYGRREFETPFVDSLALQGMRFVQAYSNSPVCSATRTALITGRYQYRLPVGLEEPVSGARDVGVPPGHPTLPSLLRQVGYHTILVGKWHLGALPNYGPLQSGYDVFYGFRGGAVDYFTHKGGLHDTDTDDLWDGDVRVQETGYLTDLLGDRAAKEIDGCAARGQSFFISLHFNAPHWPWEGPADRSVPRTLTAMAHYDGGSPKTYAEMVTRMDAQVGRVLEALQRNGLSDNTIVVFTSDNGGERFSDNWPFSGRKGELLEGGIRVPAIVRWPGMVPAGTVSEQVVASMDWLPTLLAAAGGSQSPEYPSDGVNLVPLMLGGMMPFSRTLCWRYKAYDQRAIRMGNWKWLQINGNQFLFDLAYDQMERANLKDRYSDVLRNMIETYDAWESGMLPIDAASRSIGLSGATLADRYGNTAPTPMAKPGRRKDEGHR